MIWIKFGHLIQIHHFKGGVTVNISLKIIILIIVLFLLIQNNAM